MKVKKMLSLLLSALLVLSMFAGCGGTEPASTAASVEAEVSETVEESAPVEEETPVEGSAEEAVEEEPKVVIEYPLAEEPVVLTQWGSMNPNNFSYINSLSDNTVVAELEKRTGVRLECVSVQGGPNTIDQFTLMISAGDLPDFIDNVSSCYTAGADAAIEDGFIIDLEPYLEEHCPDFVALFDEMDGLRSFAHTDEGAVPFFVQVAKNADAVCTSGYLIRQDWLDQLGLDTPETFDELHDVLAQFKSELNVESPLWMPKGVTGLLSDAYGAAASYEPMAGAYPFMAVDGEVVCGYQTEAFKDFLKEMNTWYNDGLLWKDFVTDTMAFGITTSSAYNLFLNGQMGCAYGELSDIATVAEQIGGGAVLAAIPDPTVNGEKNHLTSSATPYYSKWAISTECDDVELACEFMNYMYTQEGCDLLHRLHAQQTLAAAPFVHEYAHLELEVRA